MSLIKQIFKIQSDEEFTQIALQVFHLQYNENKIYRKFCDLLNIKTTEITSIEKIPFLPIELFKTDQVITGEFNPAQTFLSSGTTGQNQSKHLVKDLKVYEESFVKGFNQFYGEISDYCFLALLPSYMEREGSSLIYMTEYLVKHSKNSLSGFYLDEYDKLIQTIQQLKKTNQKIILLGVSFALLDFAEKHQVDLSDVIIMETGGMKGRRKELTRAELHQIYKDSFNVTAIHSEYGMTELLSQAYSFREGVYQSPKWMKILIRDINDPFTFLPTEKTGGVNVIDLANIDSCAFISTQDLGKKNNDNTFEILGRFDNSDLRGCNLLIS
ncbi:acyl transferase [Vicingus serpentipes]|uniref:Acyl transferase n=1 Tax=Vicingus serpentipes TaxID=1926625 RepID=A0A5C6RR52_9FLAO|nr:acyl transferase [Vicingus serpentipes]TXB64365.1 acyl transferase [Vicingus serpentipes]